MVSRNTTLVPSLGLCIGPACEAGLSTGMRRERVSPLIRKKERKKERKKVTGGLSIHWTAHDGIINAFGLLPYWLLHTHCYRQEAQDAGACRATVGRMHSAQFTAFEAVEYMLHTPEFRLSAFAEEYSSTNGL